MDELNPVENPETTPVVPIEEEEVVVPVEDETTEVPPIPEAQPGD